MVNPRRQPPAKDVSPAVGLARRSRVAQVLTRSGLKRPVLSVVVPVYQVEQYLGECLQSVLEQSFRDLEVIVVDDGSTDGSAAVASSFVQHDRRVRLVQQANAGLGAARNRGVEEARGRFLAFVDSDDLLVPGAYESMIEILLRTGSDLVVGGLQRFDGRRRWMTERMRRNHSVERLHITLDEMPEVLADVFAVNKVFRRDFWRQAQLAFPVGIRYEDQPALTEAFLRAGSFDVITQPVYLWRVRADMSSISQRRQDLADLRDRVVTKRQTRELVVASAPQHEQLLLADILPVDMWEYFRSVPGNSDEYWQELRLAVREFWNPSTIPFEETRVPVQQRLMGWFTSQGRRADLEALIAHIDAHGVVVDDGVFQHPWRSEPGLPEATTRV